MNGGRRKDIFGHTSHEIYTSGSSVCIIYYSGFTRVFPIKYNIMYSRLFMMWRVMYIYYMLYVIFSVRLAYKLKCVCILSSPIDFWVFFFFFFACTVYITISARLPFWSPDPQFILYETVKNEITYRTCTPTSQFNVLNNSVINFTKIQQLGKWL